MQAADVEAPVSAEHTQDSNSKLSRAQFKRLAEYLNYCRQQHKTITYLEVADAIDIRSPHRIHRLTGLLEALMEHNLNQHQPLLAALVVSRVSGLPAKGFFLKAQALGLMLTVTDAEFHQQCLNQLFNGPATIMIETE